MTPKERDPKFLIEHKYLEPITDFEYEGRNIPASRLGYRITTKFVNFFFCRIFDNPSGVFTSDMLQPEAQDLAVYVDGIENIAQAMEKSAKLYFEDGIIEDACPPLRAVLHVMAYGHYKGKLIKDPEIRSMFTRESLISSQWYQDRLLKKQLLDVDLWLRKIKYLEGFMHRPAYEKKAENLRIPEKLVAARNELSIAKGDAYLEGLVGTIGVDPIHGGYRTMKAADGNGVADNIAEKRDHLIET